MDSGFDPLAAVLGRIRLDGFHIISLEARRSPG
jgi:hypothetical protein